MLTLFTTTGEEISSVVKPPKFDQVHRTYNAGIEKVREYYQTRVFPIANQHILVQALTLGMPSLTYDIWKFLDLAYTRSETVSRHLKFTSSLIYGKIFKEQFFDSGCTEYIISETHRFDVDLAIKNWKDIRPVRVLEHPFTDVSLNILKGDKVVNNKGVCVMTINLPLLYLQYRCYTEDKDFTTDGTTGFHTFINRYVIPNMLYSYVDISIFNKLVRRLHREMDDIVLKRPVIIFPTNEPLLDRVLDDVLDRLSENGLTYPTVLSNIPSIRFSNAKESFMLPDIAETRQVYWLLMRSRLRIMKGVMDIAGEKGLVKNRNYVTQLKLELKRLNSQRVLKSLLPYDDYLDTQRIIDEIMSI